MASSIDNKLQVLPVKKVSHDTICSIDLGTSTMCYCYRAACDKVKEVVMSSFEGEKSKTMSAILLDKDTNVIAFGSEACNLYMETEEREDLLLFFQFKMALYTEESETLDRNLQLKALNGTSLSAHIVIGRVLGALKKHLFARLRLATSKPKSAKDILWILTVPAVWGNRAKSIFRKAAYEAGLLDSNDSQRLQIVLEPEAGCIQCYNLKTEDFVAGESRLRDARSYTTLVIDCGGGTVDFSILKAAGDESFHSLIKPSGGLWGGERVSDEIISFIKQCVTKAVFTQWLLEDSSGFLHLWNSVDEAKKKWQGGPMIISLVPHLCTLTNKEGIDVTQTSQNLATLQLGRLKLSEEIVHRFFSKWTSKICNHLHILFDDGKLHQVELVFLIGGFALSTVLQSSVKRTLEMLLPAVEMRVPLDAAGSIVRGALLLGGSLLDRPLISARTAARSYGLRESVIYDSAKHHGRNFYWDGNNKRCDKIFLPLCRAGELVSQMKQVEIRYRYAYHDYRRGIAFTRLYSSLSSTVQYTDEPGCDLEAVIRHPVPEQNFEGEKQCYTVVCSFGESELKIAVLGNNEEPLVETFVDFCTESSVP